MISLSRGGFSPFVVKLALGSVVIVGDQIQYLQRVQIQSNAAPSQVASPLTASPSSLSFANQTLLTPSPSQSVTLTNTGSVPLTNIAPQVSTNPSDFRVPSNTCPSSLAAAATCVVSIVSAPSATVGAPVTRTGALQVSFSPGSGAALTIPLSGSAAIPQDGVAVTSSLNFGTVKFGPPAGNATATLTIANVNAAQPLTITAIAAPAPVAGRVYSDHQHLPRRCYAAGTWTELLGHIHFTPPAAAQQNAA